jgi:small subunit ribosomal protein S20
LAVKHDSAAKRHRQSERRRLANKSAKTQVKTSVRKFMEAVKSKGQDDMGITLKALIKKLDTAAGKGIIKKNAAARKKSRMQRLYNAQKVVNQ